MSIALAACPLDLDSHNEIETGATGALYFDGADLHFAAVLVVGRGVVAGIRRIDILDRAVGFRSAARA